MIRLYYDTNPDNFKVPINQSVIGFRPQYLTQRQNYPILRHPPIQGLLS
jgi:hypothetical protein